jgi:hypothetical protein
VTNLYQNGKDATRTSVSNLLKNIARSEPRCALRSAFSVLILLIVILTNHGTADASSAVAWLSGGAGLQACLWTA